MLNVVLHDLDLHFQGQTFSCYAFALTIAHAADVPGRFTLTCMAHAAELLLFSIDKL